MKKIAPAAPKPPLPDSGRDAAGARMSRRGLLRGGIVAATSTVLGVTAAVPEIATAAASGHAPATLTVRLSINHAQYAVECEPAVTLLDLLREQLHLTGTKKGCNRGECGACTVSLDGRRVNACLVLAASADGSTVLTIEGLADGDKLHPVQQAFIDHDAFQCGFCTSGQIMSAVACIQEGHAGSHAEIREWMSGNLCRCAAYPQITAAVESAAQVMKEAPHGSI